MAYLQLDPNTTYHSVARAHSARSNTTQASSTSVSPTMRGSANAHSASGTKISRQLAEMNQPYWSYHGKTGEIETSRPSTPAPLLDNTTTVHSRYLLPSYAVIIQQRCRQYQLSATIPRSTDRMTPYLFIQLSNTKIGTPCVRRDGAAPRLIFTSVQHCDIAIILDSPRQLLRIASST